MSMSILIWSDYKSKKRSSLSHEPSQLPGHAHSLVELGSDRHWIAFVRSNLSTHPWLAQIHQDQAEQSANVDVDCCSSRVNDPIGDLLRLNRTVIRWAWWLNR